MAHPIYISSSEVEIFVPILYLRKLGLKKAGVYLESRNRHEEAINVTINPIFQRQTTLNLWKNIHLNFLLDAYIFLENCFHTTYTALFHHLTCPKCRGKISSQSELNKDKRGCLIGSKHLISGSV